MSETTSDQTTPNLDDTENDAVVVNEGVPIPTDSERPRRGGRPPIQINIKMLHAVAATFATYEEMAVIFDCSVGVLRNYKREVEKGRAMGRMTYRQEMRARAKRSDRVLIHMYEKHVEPPPQRVAGSPDGVLQIVGDAIRPLIIREVDEDSDTGNR
jgi:hypothetical protein